jgi:hypothetical protein
MNEFEKVDLETIANGQMMIRFQESLEKVLKNIMDTDMHPTMVREIKMTLKLKPGSHDEKKVAYAFIIEEKLAPLKPLVNLLYVEKSGGFVRAYEEDIEQGELFDSTA